MHASSSDRASANAVQKWLIAAGGRVRSWAKASTAASTWAVTAACTGPGTCSSAPVDCTTWSWSPGRKAAASSAGTVVYRFPRGHWRRRTPA
ncbi:hypothetical protein [Myceligenerans pegani]|uniref:Uncharacterized protein n=1 Tax=Myceligenerans pegani TaxID=2776917 RepID=A0ABR9N451_9MICO|nr:hypothetical protein [Myceligenerans sp. TRM 65318]MBE1878444.1 hypothetical protein [Myceligenerans sp. TRM 65318]MBE3020715.1 hypothetical protein [Myceligenerans sp. TRM 65318]